jgi:hypothetical protein
MDTKSEQKTEETSATVEAAAASVQAAEPAKGAPAAEDKPAKIAGLAYSGAPLKQWWTVDPLVVDLAGMTVPAKVPLLRNHVNDTNDRLGNISAKKTERGLEIEGEIVAGTDAAREIVHQGKLGADWQLSVGADIAAMERVLEGTRTANGRTYHAPFVFATKTILREVSVVAVGADRSTNMHVAAAFTPTPNLQIEMEEKDKKSVEAAAPTNTAPAAVPEKKVEAAQPDVKEVAAAAVKAERERVSAIDAACGADFPEIRAKAVAEGWDIAQTNAKLLAALRERTPVAPPTVTVKAEAPTEQVLAAALALSAGIDADTLAAGGKDAEKAVEAAAKFSGIGLKDTVRECVRASGAPVGVTMDDSLIRAAFSTVSLPGILSNVANKKLLAAYKAQPIIADKLCAKADLNDFKTAQRYRLTDVGDLVQVALDGEIKHGSLSEDGATNKLETYAKLFTLTRQMIYDDDLGAFLRVPAFMGARAARKVDQLFFARLVANPTQADGKALFHADHGNYGTGTTSALQLSSLKTAVAAFRKQKDADNQPINVMPKFLVVPVDLEVAAEEIVNGLTVVIAGSTDAARPAYNALSRYGLTVVGSPYLSSATGWYLFADPAALPAFEIGYLRGKRTPTVERGNVDFDKLGISWRVYFDVGVREQEHRGVYFAKGAN